MIDHEGGIRVTDELVTLISKTMEYLAEQGVGRGVCFENPGSDNVAYLRIQKGYARPGQLCLKIDVGPKDSDMVTGYFFHYADSMEEMKRYLLSPENVEAVRKAILELNESVNQRDD